MAGVDLSHLVGLFDISMYLCKLLDIQELQGRQTRIALGFYHY
jgi:hypothetical protein